VELHRAYGEGKYRSYTIHFVGRLIRMVEAGLSPAVLYDENHAGKRR
jgi:hypothetical protein